MNNHEPGDEPERLIAHTVAFSLFHLPCYLTSSVTRPLAHGMYTLLGFFLPPPPSRPSPSGQLPGRKHSLEAVPSLPLKAILPLLPDASAV